MRLVSLAIAAALVALAPDAEAARKLGSLTFEPCSLSPARLPVTVDAQCTTLEVPENRADPGGRKIKLYIAWVPNDSAGVAPDPVFMLAGGPGQSATENYPLMHNAFAQVRRKRHVILVDQRGTGRSNPLVCRNARGEAAFAGEDPDSTEQARQFAVDCLAKLNADARHYGTTAAVADLEAVREAIGAPTINLVGISYGTRVAQAYLRRYPDRTRAVVLDSVVPNELVLGSEHAKNLEDALDLQFAQCEKNEKCAKKFGSPRQHLDSLLAMVRANPVPVRYRDPLSNELREDRFDLATLAGVVRLFAYAPNTASLLPLSLKEAADGRPETLLAQARMISSVVGETINHGMQLSVICSEDAPLLTVDPSLASTTLGNALTEILQAECAVWPRGEVPADFHAPTKSDKPVLLMSGEFDPVTPPRYGEAVLKGLPNGRHLVLRGQGHNVLGQSCVPKLVGQFIESADAKKLDASCLDSLTYTPPFTGWYGWDP